ncbi:MAG: PKD domain-containing protein [Saprospiraceae bacterium]
MLNLRSSLFVLFFFATIFWANAQCNFTVSNPTPCASSIVSFNTSSPGTVFSWDLNGDNVIDAYGTAVSYIYPNLHTNQSYNATLYINNVACSTQVINVQGTPDANIGVIPGSGILDGSLIRVCSGTPDITLSVFNASTTYNQNLSYQIDWGDGAIENLDNNSFSNTSFISHNYTNYGYYSLKLTVTGTNGCVAIRSYTLYNGSNPSVGLANPGNTVGLCAPATVNFPITNTENNPTGTIYNVYISGQLVISYTQENVPASFNYTFLDSSCDEETTTGNYQNAFDVQVEATNPCGSSQATIEPIEVSTPPEPLFAVEGTSFGCQNETLTLENVSTGISEILSGSPSVCESTLSPSWNITPGVPGTHWNIVSGNLFDSDEIEIEFLIPGDYTITMTISSPSCGPGSFSQTFSILEAPVADGFATLYSAATPSLDDQCIPTTASLTNLSYGDSISHIWAINPPSGWEFLDTFTVFSDNPVIAFTEPGSYNIALMVSNYCGVTTWDTILNISDVPIIDLSPIPDFCEEAILDFDQNNVNYNANGSPITTYHWSFPGAIPSSSTDQYPTNISYANPGNYPVTLTVANACGINSTVDTFFVQPEGSLTISNDTIICEYGAPIQLTANPSGGNWTGSSVGNDGIFNPSSQTVGDNVVYYSYQNGGCDLQDSLLITVIPAPNVDAGEDQTSCIDAIPFLITGGSPSGGIWTVDNGGVIIGQNVFDPTSSGAGIFTLSYTYTDANGCTDSDAKTIVVNQLPTVNAGPDQSICENPFDFELTGYTPLGGSWSGIGVSANGIFNAQNTSGPGSYSLFYTYTDASSGCTNIDTLIMEVLLNEPANAGADLEFCLNDAVSILNDGIPAGGTWSGTGVNTNGGTFDPAAATVGVHIITYVVGSDECETSDTKIITVKALPQITLAPDQTICEDATNLSLDFASPSGGTWSGTAIQNNEFNIQLAGLGIHNLTYLYTDPNTGCNNEAQFSIEVVPLPTITTQDTIYCNTPGYVALPYASPAGGNWSGPGVSANQFNPSNAGGTGTYTLSYDFTDNNGCDNSATVTVTVVDPDEVDAGEDAEYCIDHAPINLSQFATPTGGTWSANGSSGLSGNQFNLHTAGAGTHVLTYTIGSGNCEVSDQVTITIKALPSIYAGPDQATCLTYDPFILSAFYPVGGTWSGIGITDPIAGQFDPVVASPGTHIISYTYTDPNTGCTNTDNKEIIVHPMSTIDFNLPPLACRNDVVSFENLGNSSYNYSWNFGDGGSSQDFNAFHIFDVAGTYTVRLVGENEFGCRDTIAKEIIIADIPVAYFVPDTTESCSGLSLNLSNQSAGHDLSYSWDFGNGQTSTASNPDIVYYGQGISDTVYIITLTVENACGSSIFQDVVTVHPLPNAEIGLSPQTDCSPVTYNFANISTGGAYAYFWDFGNGNTSTEALPDPQIYTTDTTASVYTVTLIAYSQCGTDTASQEIIVEPANVQALFVPSVTDGCAPLNVDFVNYATPGATIDWDFGDGNSSSITNISHTYQEPGSYTVIQYAGSDCGYDTTTLTITVYPGPEVSFSHEAYVCIENVIEFENNSVNTFGHVWDFGDGSTSTLNDPAHIYDTPGTYTVTLTGMSNFNQCPASFTSEVTVLGLPTSSFEPSTTYGCAPLTIDFENNSQGANFYEWNFGDGNSSTLFSPTHTFLEPGEYVVTLFATDVNGCVKDTNVFNIIVQTIPAANFDFNRLDQCGLPAEINFNNLSSGAIGFSWDFGDGTTSSLNNPTHIFQNSGTYEVKLIATNQFNCTDTSIQELIIHPSPMAEFDVENQEGCAPLVARFNNYSEVGNSYYWDFGDGHISTEKNPIHTYRESGFFDVLLIVSIGDLCYDTLRLESIINVYPQPSAHFDAIDLEDGSFEFVNNSQNATSYYWEFSDGVTSVEKDPVHRFEANGAKQILLESSTEMGCKADTLMTLTPSFFKGLFIPSGFSPEQGIGDVRLFKPKGAGLKEYKVQVFSTYGQLIWESEALKDGQPSEAWDGTYQGKLLPQDVYVWKAYGIFEDGTNWKGEAKENGGYKTVGSVILLR